MNVTAKDDGVYESEDVEVVGSQSSPQYDVVLVVGYFVIVCLFIPRPSVWEIAVSYKGGCCCACGGIKGGSIERGEEWVLCRAAIWLLFCQRVLGATVMKWR